jgi:tRNA modification GTPase
MHALDETIVAIASPHGGGARGIVRLSGPNLRGCLEKCFRPDPPQNLASVPRAFVAPGILWLEGYASPARCQLFLWPGKRSYTGQPVAEVHTIGSPPLLEAVVRAACRGGARPAEPGEFTLRAFLAGRIDLTQAEAVLGVIDASGTAELDAALKQLAGGLAGPLRKLRSDLLELLAHLEAGFDFADEDLPFITAKELLGQLQTASSQVDDLVEKLAFRGESTARVRVALVGPPNAGKSSLFNALAGRQGAIVSDIAGTTRDYLTAELDLDGVKCELIDTAGIEDVPMHDGTDAVKAAAQQMSQDQFRTAHVRIECAEATGAGVPALAGDCEQHQINQELQRIFVLTKCDRPYAGLSSLTDAERQDAECQAGKPDVLRTSAVTGEGIRELKSAIRAAVLRASMPQSEVVAGTAVRCGESLRLAAASLERARAAVSDGLGEELIATEVRVALHELGKVAGAIYTEDVLDRIFSRFCIGK